MYIFVGQLFLWAGSLPSAKDTGSSSICATCVRLKQAEGRKGLLKTDLSSVLCLPF